MIRLDSPKSKWMKGSGSKASPDSLLDESEAAASYALLIISACRLFNSAKKLVFTATGNFDRYLKIQLLDKLNDGANDKLT